MAYRLRRLIADMNGYDTPFEVFSTLKEGYACAVVYVDDSTGELLSGPDFPRPGEKIPIGEGLAVVLEPRIFKVDIEIDENTVWDEFADDIAAAFDRALRG